MLEKCNKVNTVDLTAALHILETNGISINPPVLRKHIREGKIRGCFISSKKEGYQISIDGLMLYVYMKKNDFMSIYKLGYEKGIKRGRKLRK